MIDVGRLLGACAGRSVLVVGDVMLDETLHGVPRDRPGDEVPVLRIESRDARPGGAANAATNVVGLGGHAVLVGVVGDDADGRELVGLLAGFGGLRGCTVVDVERNTTRKTRIASPVGPVLRLDREVARPIPADIERRLLDGIEAHAERTDAIVLSDYGKGVLTPDVCRRAIGAARTRGIPVVVDSKAGGLDRFQGASVLVPNELEARALAPSVDGSLDAVAASLVAAVPGAGIVVTRDRLGLSRFVPGRTPLHVPAEAREVRDPVGAGDTVVAALALALAAGADLDDAVKMASAAAAVAVAKAGTAVVTAGDLLGGFEVPTSQSPASK